MHRLRGAPFVPVILALLLGAAALPIASPLASAPSVLEAPTRPAATSGDVAAATAPPPAERTVQLPPRRDGGPRATQAGPLSTSIQPGAVDRASVQMTTTYDVALRLNFGNRTLTVDTVLAATNTSGGPVDRLELNTIAARLGGLKLTNVSVDGRAASATVRDQTIVLPLGGVLLPGATVKARVVYTATLRNSLTGSNWMFTRVNGIANLYRWLPWVSREQPFDRPNHGDPYVTAVSPRVTVKVTTDRPLVLATSGDRLGGSGLTQTFEARNVRDFTITAAPDFKTTSRKVGRTTVRVWYRPGFPAKATLDAAADALAKMNALVGEYPYANYRIAQSAGGYGMESPSLTWVPTGVKSANLRYLVFHETAHQWFYGLVGGDQANEPFTDEAAADFLARHALKLKRASRCATGRLDLSIYRYSSACYYEVVYIQGGNFLDDLRARMGSTAFWRGMRAWIDANRFGIASTKSLLDMLDAHTPLSLVPRYEPRFPRLY